LVLDTLSSFTIAVDSLIDSLNEEQEQQAQEYIDSAHAVLDKAHTLSIELDAKMRNTPLADLVIRDAHGPYHQGIEHTIATVRSEYWIPKLRQQVRKLVQKCVKCRRFNSLPYQYPSTTDLPDRRVQRSRAFQHIGLDFFDLPSSTAACLNTRPLTYQGATQEDLTLVRPIDFIQKDIKLSLPIANVTPASTDDPEYLPSDEARALRTHQDVIDALQSSWETTEKFWTIWHQQYLTSLRETHKALLTKKRQSQEVPTIGDVVLVSTRPGNDAAIRDVELITATRRKIRRPPNLLIPLEVESQKEDETASQQTRSDLENFSLPATPQRTHPYNLRQRPPRNTKEVTVSTVQSPTRRRPSGKWFLFYIMLLTYFRTCGATTSVDMKMDCTGRGVLVSSIENNRSFEICADSHCQLHNASRNPYLVRFPPDTTLHEHQVTLKWHMGERMATMETTCPGLDFCENIDCFFCAHILFNPECWPLGALLLMLTILYAIVATLYLLLYVPMTIGKPIRLLLYGI
uniref:Integrase_H2C2 domain-containing protein n=1 Tax=Heligmosomoides polygyrus TaxID=6339 RepID=A0A183G4Y5_HELPZ